MENMISSYLKDFISGYSIEVIPKTVAKTDSFGDILPKSTRIYLAHLKDEHIGQMVAAAKKLRCEGFSVMPHIPARVIKNQAMLSDWLSMYQNEAGVDEALLLAGGSNEPKGDYDSSIQLIESGLFDKAGFKRLHIAGHPDGNKDIDPSGGIKNVSEALSWKQEFFNRTDAKMAITTQFCFDANVIKKWADDIKDDGIDIPIHIGIAGPAKLQTLLKFSIECGIGSSMKILTKRAKDITKLLLPYEPTQVLKELAEYKAKDPKFNIEQVHFFPFGGVKETSDWVREVSND
ncbi:methylenetetrahydrofolate reductase [Gammaproteobacteria bacterium]|nr:methylenetetrahydrofolate reductase [Gammaproteobacteria bacterium]